jgi:outer membrane beta-barrel protein
VRVCHLGDISQVPAGDDEEALGQADVLIIPVGGGQALSAEKASAQETVDVGVVTSADVRVVQKLLYPKDGRTEMGLHLGWMPFDAYLTTPNAQFSFNKHQSESLSLSAVAGVGYGLKNGTYRELESPTYGVAPDAYRYLGSVLVGAEAAPAYAKVNLNGKRIFHYDVYGSGRAGVTVEKSVIPSGGMAVAPTLSLGVGSRVFLSPGAALRLELRDDFLIEHRKLTDSTHLKQNVNVVIGYTVFSPQKATK